MSFGRFASAKLAICTAGCAFAVACSSSGGNGTVTTDTNTAWSRGASSGATPADLSRHIPWEDLLPDGQCPDPDAESECSDGDGCCPSNGVCCDDGTCASDSYSCTSLPVALGCPITAPVECGAVCCGYECCADGTCDSCGGSSGNGTGDDGTGNPYEDVDGGESTDPGGDPGSTEPSEPQCDDGQYVCGDDCCDSKKPGVPLHARRSTSSAVQMATKAQRSVLLSASTAAK